MKRVVLFSYDFNTNQNYVTPVEAETYYLATAKAERLRESIRRDFPTYSHFIISEEDAT